LGSKGLADEDGEALEQRWQCRLQGVTFYLDSRVRALTVQVERPILGAALVL